MVVVAEGRVKRAIMLMPVIALAIAVFAFWQLGCDERDNAAADVTMVTIAGKRFWLETAASDQIRVRGLGGRTYIEPDGGMLFAFPAARVGVMEFVMRDCPVDIDIAYLDGSGKVLATHTMKSEPPRGPGEGKQGEFTNEKYENRLKKYSSGKEATFAVELAAGSFERLGVKPGDVVQFDHAGLKARAR